MFPSKAKNATRSASNSASICAGVVEVVISHRCVLNMHCSRLRTPEPMLAGVRDTRVRRKISVTGGRAIDSHRH